MLEALPLSHNKAPTLVVGIGLAAGGLKALKIFFSTLPADVRLAFVLVYHPEAIDDDALAEAISRSTPIPLEKIHNEGSIKANRIYFPPAKCSLEIIDGKLRAVSSNQDTAIPINNFFQELARDQGGNAVGILLSGAGSDGTLGLKAIAENGGMTIAQDSASAEYDTMPRTAIATGVVDHVLPPAEMISELLRYAQHIKTANGANNFEAQREAITEHLRSICDALFKETNHDFNHYKTATLVRRIHRRLQILRLNHVTQYLERLQQDRQERQALFKDLLIGVTAFLRDAEAFSTFTRQVIPKLLKDRPPNEPVRVWVPGCATGEEAYTLAMLFQEQMDECPNSSGVQIFATDIDEQALGIARLGRYSETVIEDLSAQRVQRFFIKQGKKYQVAKPLRELCFFSHHNLINDPPFSRMDLISCRNVLIYLGPHLQKKLISVFHYALRPNGYLFLGSSENISAHKELFHPLSAEHRIYQCKKTLAMDTNPRLSTSGNNSSEKFRPDLPMAEPADLGKIAQRIILDEFSPRHGIINQEGEVLYLSDGVGKYLEPAAGRFSSNIVKMARSSLRAGLRATISEANSTRRRIVHANLSVETEQGLQRVLLTVQPMPKLGEDSPLHMVVFQDVGLPFNQDSSEVVTSEGKQLITQLEKELNSTRRDLEHTVQALEVSNDKLKTSNEELLSINEELRSANEELETAKEETEHSNMALERANDDLENLLESTQIATVFLDKNLNIQRFTPATTKLYNLIASDVGRPLTDITHHARSMPPLPSFETIAYQAAPIREQIETDDGHWYLRRVLPYRTQAGHSDGMVVTFTDITALHASEERYQRQLLELETLYHTAPVGLALFDSELCYLRINERLAEINGASPAQHEGRTLREIVPDLAATNEPLLRHVFETGEAISEREITGFTPSAPNTERVWLVSYHPIKGLTNRVETVSVVVQEITERKRIEAVLQETARHKDEYLTMLAHELRNPLAPLRNAGQVLRILNLPDPKVHELQAIIERQVGHMSNMLDGLLDVTRIARGKIQIEPTKLELRQLVQHIVEDFRATIEAKGLALQVHCSAEPVWIRGDETRLTQAISNLLQNALKFTESSGKITVNVTPEISGNKAVVRIRDSGIGMTPRLITQVFEPFRQGERSFDRSPSGLGLGLALVKGFVELHGGTVQASSHGIGQGSEFTIALPLLAEPMEEKIAPAEQTHQDQLSILVVDDMRDTADTLRLILEHEGHAVAVAYNGDDCLATLKTFRPNVVLCDIGLPGKLDGYAIARAVRSDPLLRSIFLIAITGYGSEHDREEAKQAGFDDHLIKPVSFEAVQKSLNKWQKG